VLGVPFGHPRGHEALDALSQEILRRPAEHLFDFRVGVHDPPAAIDGNHGIGACVEHRFGA
jgi:hypothetical protein